MNSLNFRICYFLLMIVTSAQSQTLEVADSLYQTGNFSKAIEIYQTKDSNPDIYERIAKSYVALGNYGQALNYYEQALNGSPNDVLVRYDYAKLLSRTKKYDLASSQFETLLNVDDHNPNYHYELGLVKEKLDDTLALDQYQLAYKLDPTHQKAIFKIAKHLIKKRQHAEAEQLIDIGLSSYDENIELLSLKAQNYYYADDYEKAIDAFEVLLAMGESSEFIHEKLSLCYAEYSDYEKAIEQRKKVLRFNPMDANSMFVIGTYYSRLNQFDKAESYVHQALKIKDQALDYEYQFLGTLYNRQKKYEQAIKMFTISLEEDPENLSSALFLVTTKDAYYSDREAVIKLYEQLKVDHPDTFVEVIARRRIQELKEEQFLKAEN